MLSLYPTISNSPTSSLVPAIGKLNEWVTVEKSPLRSLSDGVVLSCSAREDELRSEMLKGGANLPGDDRLRLEMHEAAASYDDRKAASIFAHLAKNKTWQVPTLVVRVQRYT